LSSISGPLIALKVKFAEIPDYPTSTAFLRLVEGHVGASQELVAIGYIRRKQGSPDAGAHFDCTAADAEWLL